MSGIDVPSFAEFIEHSRQQAEALQRVLGPKPKAKPKRRSMESRRDPRRRAAARAARRSRKRNRS